MKFSTFEILATWFNINLSSFIGAGLVLDWEQESGMLLASGDVRIIRIWDSQRETKVQVNSIWR